MADVFISYASEDRARSQLLAAVLEESGRSVWWDRNIVAGRSFDEVIEHELESAKSVVVLWSQHSVSSEWVKNEAAVAAERGVLVPALIGRVKIPLEFRRKQTVDLISWKGDPSDPGFQALYQGIVANIHEESSRPIAAHQVASRFSRPSVIAVVVSIVAALTGMIVLYVTLMPHGPAASKTYVNVSTGFCLDSDAKGKVYALGCNGGNYQNWESQGKRLINVSTGFCLDSDAKGNVYTLGCNGGNYQNWESQGKRLINVSTGFCLDSDAKGNVYTLGCNDGNYQNWN